MNFTRSMSIILATGFAVLALGTPPPVSAQPYEFVRVTCVPENQYLEITYETVEQDVVDDGHQGGEAFAKHGYLDPRLLDYQCKLGNATYLLSSRQDPAHATGTCGAAPPIILTIRRDKAVLVDGVPFGKTCSGDASIMRLWIHDSDTAGRPPEMSLCIAPRILDFGARDPEEVCPYLARGEVASVIPITTGQIELCKTRAVESSCLMELGFVGPGR